MNIKKFVSVCVWQKSCSKHLQNARRRKRVLEGSSENKAQQLHLVGESQHSDGDPSNQSSNNKRIVIKSLKIQKCLYPLLEFTVAEVQMCLLVQARHVLLAY